MSDIRSPARNYEVHAARDGRWWYFRVPEFDTSGQARTLSAVSIEARDVIATWLRVDEREVDVTVHS